MLININGKNAKFSSGMDTSLKDGDEVYILPAVAGGSELSNEELDRSVKAWHTENASHNRSQKIQCTFVFAEGSLSRMSARLVEAVWSCLARSSPNSGSSRAATAAAVRRTSTSLLRSHFRAHRRPVPALQTDRVSAATHRPESARPRMILSFQGTTRE